MYTLTRIRVLCTYYMCTGYATYVVTVDTLRMYASARKCERTHVSKYTTERTRICARVLVYGVYACPGGDVSAQTEPEDNGYQQWIYRRTCVGVLGYRY